MICWGYAKSIVLGKCWKKFCGRGDLGQEVSYVRVPQDNVTACERSTGAVYGCVRHWYSWWQQKLKRLHASLKKTV